MATKQSIETQTAELRVLNELVDNTAADTNATWLTPAFWTMAATALTNLVSVAAMIGWIDSTQVETLTKALLALAGAAQVIIVNTVLVWKYISGQNKLQAQKLEARYHYLEAVAVEKLRVK